MKVGDLVKCTTLHGRCNSGEVGIIVQSYTDWRPHRHDVLLNGRSKSWPFMEKQLEVINESR